MLDIHEFWGPPWPDGAELPPATIAEVRHWESEHGVRLPASLAAAYRNQNGGVVRGTSLLLRPLLEIRPFTDDEWTKLCEFDERNRVFGNPSRLFSFAIDDAFSATLILDYNNSAPEPRVVWLWRDLGDELRYEGDEDFDELVHRARARAAGAPNHSLDRSGRSGRN